MTIDRDPHFDPDESWGMLNEWITRNVKDPDGKDVSADVAKILSVGAFIGFRFGLVSRQFALAVAEHCNSYEEHPVFSPIKEAFARDYAEWLAVQMANYAHNIGFTDVGTKVLPPDQVPGQATTAPAPTPVSEDDVREISSGLDDFMRGLRDA